jgi:hypothetical protein
VLAARSLDPLVEQDLPAGLVDHVPRCRFCSSVEVGHAGMGAPQQPADLHAPPGQLGQDLAQLGALAVQELVGVAAPVGEADQVALAAGPQGGQQPPVVGGPVDQRLRPGCPRSRPGRPPGGGRSRSPRLPRSNVVRQPVLNLRHLASSIPPGAVVDWAAVPRNKEPTGVRHRRIGSTDLVVQRGRAGRVAAGRRAGGAARRGRRRPARGGPRPRHRLLRGHRHRRRRPGRASSWAPAVRGHRDEVTVATTFGYDTTPGSGSRPRGHHGTTGRPNSPAGPWTPRCAGCAWSRSTCGCCTTRAWTPSSPTSCSSSWRPRSRRARSATTAWPSARARVG